MVKTRNIDIAICVVHPDHSSFYKRFGFTEIATSIMTGLDHAPAALLVIKRQDVRL
jgi:predicted acetyltransferase